jgi:hypothetical protein
MVAPGEVQGEIDAPECGVDFPGPCAPFQTKLKRRKEITHGESDGN